MGTHRAQEVLQPHAGGMVDERVEVVDCSHGEVHCGMTREVVEVDQHNIGPGLLVVDGGYGGYRDLVGAELGAAGSVCRIREMLHRTVI